MSFLPEPSSPSQRQRPWYPVGRESAPKCRWRETRLASGDPPLVLRGRLKHKCRILPFSCYSFETSFLWWPLRVDHARSRRVNVRAESTSKNPNTPLEARAAACPRTSSSIRALKRVYRRPCARVSWQFQETLVQMYGHSKRVLTTDIGSSGRHPAG